MSYFIKCNSCKIEYPETPEQEQPIPENPCPNCGADFWAQELFRNSYTFSKGNKKKTLVLSTPEFEKRLQKLYDDGWVQEGVLGFPPSVVRNKGRKVTGELADKLKAIDKGYGSKSNISDSVDLGTFT